jgi:hypothetical protein
MGQGVVSKPTVLSFCECRIQGPRQKQAVWLAPIAEQPSSRIYMSFESLICLCPLCLYYHKTLWRAYDVGGNRSRRVSTVGQAVGPLIVRESKYYW